MQEIQYIYMCTHVYICVCMNIHRILTNTMPFFFSTEKRETSCYFGPYGLGYCKERLQ